MALPDFPIPQVNYFTNRNSFCGSRGQLNYRILPVEADEGNGTDAHLEAYTWYGMLCSDLSEKQATATFPMTQEGRDAAVDWLREQEKLCLALSEK